MDNCFIAKNGIFETTYTNICNGTNIVIKNSTWDIFGNVVMIVIMVVGLFLAAMILILLLKDLLSWAREP